MDEFEDLSHSKWECKYHVVKVAQTTGAALATPHEPLRAAHT
jgi:hypothetical protein